MISSTLIGSLLGFLSLAAAVPGNQQASRALEKAVSTSYNGLQLKIQDILSCQEVHANLDATDTNIKSMPCYLNVTAGDLKAAAVPITDAVIGPICANEGTRPGLVDATTLCEFLPTSFDLPPAYDSNTCSCETWSLGTALFAFCNCDVCSGIGDSGLNTICQDIYDDCILENWARGYISQTNPSAFWTLWGAGGALGASPIYTACG